MLFGVILAGGVGKRMKSYSIPKQFIKIGNIPIIVYSLRTFLSSNKIDKYIVTLPKDYFEYGKNIISRYISSDDFEKLVFIEGGSERFDSLQNVLDYISSTHSISSNDFILTHDAVRPFIEKEVLEECIEKTIQYNFALVSIPVNDTVYISNEESFLTGTLDRSLLKNGQTPSGFNLKTLNDECKKLSESERKNFTGTIQYILKLGYKVRIVDGNTKNFKITTDSDINIAKNIVESVARSNSIQLLDCTLRDGGIAIDFNFGKDNIYKIKECLEKANVDIIEFGYIDSSSISSIDKTKFNNELDINPIISKKEPNCKYVAMIDYGTYDLENLSPRIETGIDGIRFAFHKEKYIDAIECAKIIIDKGYDLYVQPMISTRYDDEEFINLIELVNHNLPAAKAFYIVDSFGQMDPIGLLNKVSLADQYLLPNISLGFHSHNNRQLAFANSLAFVNTKCNHNLVIDASIMGMGKGAGNLCTELIIPFLNKEEIIYLDKGIHSLISSYFERMKKEGKWGYSLDYYLSSIYGVTPSYVKIFLKDERVDTNVLIDLLSHIPEEKKVACDRSFASEYLNKYFGN